MEASIGDERRSRMDINDQKSVAVKSEVDEMWSFVGSKENKQRIWSICSSFCSAQKPDI